MWPEFGASPDKSSISASPAVAHARYRGLQSAIERLSSAGIAFVNPVQICEWNGDARVGRFVHIDATTCALHLGRGSYVTLDIQRDLNGVCPDEALRCLLSRSGTVREPDIRRSYNAR